LSKYVHVDEFIETSFYFSEPKLEVSDSFPAFEIVLDETAKELVEQFRALYWDFDV